jgi:hypothetical protein
MVRRRTARGELWGEESVCVNVSGLCLETTSSPGHDDDAHVPVLINRSVTENQLNSQVLRHVV